MNEQLTKEVYAHALREYPRESCGLVYVASGKEIYVPCQNISESASEHFILSPEDWNAVASKGDITRVVHSHPNASPLPSEGDLVMCEETDVPWTIVSVFPGEGIGAAPYVSSEHTFVPSGYVAPLVGRSFVHGILDCYSLVKDWYSRELHIELPEFERRDNWWLNGQDLYMENFKKAGFEQVELPLQYGDIILMQIRSPVANHSAVYIGDGQILQHLYGRLSTRDVYPGYWGNATRAIVRRIPDGR